MPAFLTEIINILVFLLPGFIFIELFRARYPTKKDTDTARILHSILWSILIFGISLSIDEYFEWELLSGIQNTKITDKNFTSILKGNYFKFIILLLSVSFLFAITRIWLRKLSDFIAKKCTLLSFASTKPQHIWPKTNILNNESPQWSVVITTDGQRYLGWISDYAYDPNDIENDDLFIAEAKCVNEDLSVIYEITGRGVYISKSQVSRVEYYK